MCRRLFEGRGGQDAALQGSTVQITGLSKGTHHFECCIHPWMRMNVEVK
jgi:plastocyanin